MTPSGTIGKASLMMVSLLTQRLLDGRSPCLHCIDERPHRKSTGRARNFPAAAVPKEYRRRTALELDWIMRHTSGWRRPNHQGGAPSRIGLTQVSDCMKEFSIDRASGSEAELVCSNLQAFNRNAVGEISFSSIQLVVKDGAGRLIGGAIAEVALGWLEVVVLWVDEGARGNGIGSRLLAACEENAASLGAHSARLDTFDWQALDFYSRSGYTIFGELADYPQGRKRYFMSKSLHSPP